MSDKTTQELIAECTTEMSNTCFNVGRLRYEIQLKEREQSDLDIKFHNLNIKAQGLQKALAKEQVEESAKAATTEVKLSAVPAAVVEAQAAPSAEVV